MPRPPHGWCSAGAVIFTLLVGANLATPLYALLQVRLFLGPFGVSVAFATYVLSLVSGLMVAGHWSDHIGRRAALLVAVLVALAGGLVFAAATNLAMLCAGRALQGVAVALATGASSAALRECFPSRPEWASRFTLLLSSGGVAMGPVVGGLLSMLPDPTRAPFVVHSIVLVLLLFPLYLLRARPAIRPAEPGTALATLLPRRLVVPRETRGTFWFASSVGFLELRGVWLLPVPGARIFRPSFAHRLPRADRGPGCPDAWRVRTEPAGGRPGKVPGAGGLLILGTSVALVAVAGSTAAPWLLVAASVTAGIGQGLAFRVVFQDISGKVDPARFLMKHDGCRLSLPAASLPWHVPVRHAR